MTRSAVRVSAAADSEWMCAGRTGRSGYGDHQLAGHLRVYQQTAGVLEEEDHDLAPAGNPLDAVPRELVIDHFSWGGEDPFVQDLHRDHRPAGEGSAQVPAECLDLR